MRIGKSIITLLAAFWTPVGGAAPASPQLCHLPGQRDALRCTRLGVPRDYADANAGTIDLHITVAPAIRARAEADPLFVLAGGPGQAGSDIVFLLDDAFAKVRANRDIVFIDQRGTGRSGRLHCGDNADALVRSDDELQAEALACLQGFGAGLLPYSTDAAAQDIERVRIALGYAQINLWGGSYGSRLAQVYAQRYPAPVRSLILDGVVDADLIIGTSGAESQAALDAVLQRCARDAECDSAFPELRRQLDDLLRKLDASVATAALPHPRSGRTVTVPISRERLLRTIRFLLYSPRGSAQLPYLIARAGTGDWRPLLAAETSAADLAVAPPADALLLAITCREDWPRLDAQQRADEAGSGVFASASLTGLDALCNALALPPLLPQAAQALAMPSLLLSGALDPVTPPSRAERALRRLPQAQHVIAANAGHIVSGHGCAPTLLRHFLDAPRRPVDAACLADIALPAFLTSAAGAAP